MAATQAEEEQRLMITGAVDMQKDEIIALEDAIELGIVDKERTTFFDTLNKTRMPIRQAMELGYVVMEMKVMSRRVQKTTYGMITITQQQHTKACKILAVYNRQTGEKVTPKKAIQTGLMDKGKNWVLDTVSNQMVLLKDAIDQKLVEVEDRGKPQSDPTALGKQQYEVHFVLDRRSGKRLAYDESIRAGLLSPETGDYSDTLENKRLAFVDAVKLGYIYAKLLESPSDSP